MEILDIVDKNGIPTGTTVERTVAHSQGIRHRTAHIWISRKCGDSFEILLQKRALGKDSFPGCYDTSSAGHIQAGDEPLDSAIRELHEELGINAAREDLAFAGIFKIAYETEFYGKKWADNEVCFVYSYSKPVDIESLSLQKEEVDSVAWFDIDRVLGEKKRGNKDFCVPVEGLETIRKYLLKS